MKISRLFPISRLYVGPVYMEVLVFQNTITCLILILIAAAMSISAGVCHPSDRLEHQVSQPDLDWA